MEGDIHPSLHSTSLVHRNPSMWLILASAQRKNGTHGKEYIGEAWSYIQSRLFQDIFPSDSLLAVSSTDQANTCLLELAAILA